MKQWLKNYWLLSILLIIVFIAGIFALWLIYLYQSEFGTLFPMNIPIDTEINITNQPDRGSWGALGDFFGGALNPFFAFLGLLMLLLTLYQNQKELSLSRKEFEYSRVALQDQAKTLEKQRFEDTFFALLNQHNILLGKIDNVFVYNQNDVHPKRLDIIGLENIKTLKDAKKALLSRDYPDNQSTRKYLGVLYQLLKLIASNCPESGLEFSKENLKNTIASSEEKKYSNIIRAFLSGNIYCLLAINCYCEKEEDDVFYEYKQLIERYSMFEHMALSLEDINGFNKPILMEIVNYYKKTAFGDNEEYLQLINSLPKNKN